MDSLSYCSMMTLTEACRSFMLFWALCELLDVDVLLESFWWPLASGKVPHCSTLSAFVYNGSHRGSTESQSLRNGFEPCPD